MSHDIYAFSANDARGEPLSLATFKNKVLLIVNTASKCGFTPQFEGLEKLYQQFGPEQFTVLGFPCNQFMSQDPGTDSEIQTFCQKNYGVSFPVFSKIEVNGEQSHPLYNYLKEQAPGLMGSKGIKWNFTKFLVDHQGKVIKRYAPKTRPEDIAKDIEHEIGKTS